MNQLISFNSLSLQLQIGLAKDCAGKVRADKATYAARAASVLDAAMGSEKKEAAENLNAMLNMMDLLAELIDKTVVVLQNANKQMQRTDESLAHDFSAGN